MHHARPHIALLLAGVVLLGACELFGSPEQGGHEPAALAGGATTIFSVSSHAFSQPAPNLSEEHLALHQQGDVAFEGTFVAAPAAVNPGLGPIYNRTSCVVCHANDGRSARSKVLRVSLPGRTGPHGGPAPVPGFGSQIQDEALFGVRPEARAVVTYTDSVVALSGGVTVTLREPHVRLVDPYRPLPDRVLTSLRMARPVFGLGLLEAVPAQTIRAIAREQARRTGDGITGEPNVVWDAVAEEMRVGRFGWKANQPSVLQQAAIAYQQDMGLTTPVFLKEPGAGQPGHEDGRANEPEVSRETLEAVTFYVQTLGVPARRGLDDPQALRGERLFREIGCATCHRPTLETGTLEGVPEVSDQTIHPYTDLLLHDMGPGLADGRPVYEASGREWRTPPLWGIGLTRLVNGQPGYLHDGRARTLTEAILWHGGEARASREAFRRLSPKERDALLAFLRSL